MKKIIKNIIITIYSLSIALGFFGLIDRNVLPKNILIYIVVFLVGVVGFCIIDKVLRIDEK